MLSEMEDESLEAEMAILLDLEILFLLSNTSLYVY